MLISMDEQPRNLEALINAPNFAPEPLGAKFWYEQDVTYSQRRIKDDGVGFSTNPASA